MNKKILIVSVVVLILCLSLTGCFEKKQNDEINQGLITAPLTNLLFSIGVLNLGKYLGIFIKV